MGLLLGDKKPFTKHKVKLKKDDMLYIYSDGYQDQFGGERGKKYMAWFQIGATAITYGKELFLFFQRRGSNFLEIVLEIQIYFAIE